MKRDRIVAILATPIAALGIYCGSIVASTMGIALDDTYALEAKLHGSVYVLDYDMSFLDCLERKQVLRASNGSAAQFSCIKENIS